MTKRHGNYFFLLITPGSVKKAGSDVRAVYLNIASSA